MRWITLGRQIRFAVGSVVAWGIAVGVVALVLQGRNIDFWALPGLPLAVGVTMGVVAAGYELFVLPRVSYRLTSRRVFVARALFYALASSLAVTVLSALMAAVEFSLPLRAVVAEPIYRDFLGGRTFWSIVGLLTLASVWINYTRQIRLMLGPGTMWSLLIGRYARPVREERVFLFVDITDSTPIAERLGPVLFNQFKNDFFYDVSEPVLATRGQIYQYVGDEVVVTWPVRKGRARGNAIQAYALLEERVAAAREHYEALYGVAPLFKAGIHVGPVVTAEVGDLKKDIVHSGDTVNAASRIIGQCRPLGAKLLISAAAAALLDVPEGLEIKKLGPVSLRGKEEAITLFRIDRLSEVVAAALVEEGAGV